MAFDVMVPLRRRDRGDLASTTTPASCPHRRGRRLLLGRRPGRAGHPAEHRRPDAGHDRPPRAARCSTTSSSRCARCISRSSARSTGPRSAAASASRSPPTSASRPTRAYFRAAGINNGLTASELGLSYLLPRAIGSSRAFEIMLSGRDVDAAEAERIGTRLARSCHARLARRLLRLRPSASSASRRPGIELTKRSSGAASTPRASPDTWSTRASRSCSCA